MNMQLCTLTELHTLNTAKLCPNTAKLCPNYRVRHQRCPRKTLRLSVCRLTWREMAHFHVDSPTKKKKNRTSPNSMMRFLKSVCVPPFHLCENNLTRRELQVQVLALLSPPPQVACHLKQMMLNSECRCGAH